MNRGGQLSLDLAPGILEILANVANLPRNLVLLSLEPCVDERRS